MNAMKILAAALSLLALPVLAQQAGSPPYTPRNLLDNGSFVVHQLGTATVTCATTSAATVAAVAGDRWVCDANVTSGAGRSQVITTGLPTGAVAAVKVWRNSGSLGQPVCTIQTIPTADATRLAGKAVTLSFAAEALAGLSADNGNLIFATVIAGTGTDEGYASWTASPAITPAWTGISTLQNLTQGLSTSWVNYNMPTVNVPSTVTELGVQLCFTPGTATSGGATDGFAVTNIQLEVGGPTPFENRTLAAETTKAQSYLYTIAEGAAFKARGVCEIDTTSIALCFLEFPQPMSAAPTMTYTAGFSATNVATAVACTALTTAAVPTGNAASPSGVLMNCASSAGFSAASTAAIFGDDTGTGVITAWTGL